VTAAARAARLRLGAVALGASALLLAIFPLLRPFFPLDVFVPERSIAAAAPAFASTAWLVSHCLAMLGFVLLQGGALALYGFLAGSASERLAFRGLVWSLPGVAFILPALGVETFSMPVIGQLYEPGWNALAPVLALTYRGPMTGVLLVGQGFLAVGAYSFAVAIRRDGRLPALAAFAFATGLALWLPMLPRPIRVADGLLIGIGGLPLAWRLVRAAPSAVAVAAALLLTAAPPATADCASDCQSAYRSCRGNSDSCLSQQGVCLNRCTVDGGGGQRHGAIAYSELKEVYGYSRDFGTPREAASAAVGNCRKEDKGASDCRVVVTFRNACGALARGDKGAYGSAWATSSREAASKALAECRPHGGSSCKIERQVCSGGGRQ